MSYPSSPDDGPIEAEGQEGVGRPKGAYPSSPDDGPIEAWGAGSLRPCSQGLSVVPGRRPH